MYVFSPVERAFLGVKQRRGSQIEGAPGRHPRFRGFPDPLGGLRNGVNHFDTEGPAEALFVVRALLRIAPQTRE